MDILWGECLGCLVRGVLGQLKLFRFLVQQFYQQMDLEALRHVSNANKENSTQRPKPRHHRNVLEEEAMQRLNELSEIDANRLNYKQGDGFAAWNKAEEARHIQSKMVKIQNYPTVHNPILKVKFRGFSFWKRCETKLQVEKEREKTEALKEQRRNTANSSTANQFRTNTDENTEKVSSNQIFVRKFPRKDKSQVDLAKRYLVNSALKEDMNQIRVRSFESQSKTMFVNKRRPKTGSCSNITRLSNDFSRHNSFDKSQDPKIKLDKLIAESEKLMRNQKKKSLNKKLERESERKNNPFFKILKEKYKSFIYAAEPK